MNGSTGSATASRAANLRYRPEPPVRRHPDVGRDRAQLAEGALEVGALLVGFVMLMITRIAQTAGVLLFFATMRRRIPPRGTGGARCAGDGQRTSRRTARTSHPRTSARSATRSTSPTAAPAPYASASFGAANQ